MGRESLIRLIKEYIGKLGRVPEGGALPNHYKGLQGRALDKFLDGLSMGQLGQEVNGLFMKCFRYYGL